MSSGGTQGNNFFTLGYNGKMVGNRSIRVLLCVFKVRRWLDFAGILNYAAVEYRRAKYRIGEFHRN